MQENLFVNFIPIKKKMPFTHFTKKFVAKI